MNIDDIKKTFEEKLRSATTVEKVEEVEITFLGRKGELNSHLKSLKDLSEEERKSMGKKLNELKQSMHIQLTVKKEELALKEINETLRKERIDISEPSFRELQGHPHPLSLVQRKVEEIFGRMGFMIGDGPEVESDYYNFEALNVPSYHPARDLQDTFWMKNGFLMRTQTSPVQIRSMLKYGAPIKLIVPGRTFRYESTDASHDHTFSQVEGLVLDKHISIADLNGVMEKFLGEIFHTKATVRLRPGYFPFVEPGLELDMQCTLCGGKGCRVCKQTGWIEFMGCGMVHPHVLRAGGVDPDKYQGFAFGFGLTRLVLMMYHIPDIRLILHPHYQFNVQF